jgi:hypothetical protein
MGLLEPDGRGRRLFRRDELTLAGPAIIVHSLPHAVAALTAAATAGRSVILVSAPNAGIYGGPGWWTGLIAAARAAVPNAPATALLDCGDDAGAAQAAIRAGAETIVFTGPAAVANRLADIAGQYGCRLVTARPTETLDLAEIFFAPPDQLHRRCAEYLDCSP